MNTSDLIEAMMLENTGKAFGDSGDVYGRHYEDNQSNGINKNTSSPIDFYLDEENKTIQLSQTVPIYEFLTKHLDRTSRAENIEEILYEVCDKQGIDLLSIWEIQDLFENDFIGKYVYDKYYDETINDFNDDYYYGDIPSELYPSEYFRDFEWINTYNGDEYVSQTLQFMPFSDGLNEYVLLQIHGGCDVRGGYTYPRIFEVCEMDYFLMYMDMMYTMCDCGAMDLTLRSYDEISNCDGDFLDNTDIYNMCYVDEENNLRCKECNSIILEYVPDF